MAPFREKDCASREWLVSKLFPDADVPWEAESKAIASKEFTSEAEIWMAIICSRISYAGNIWNVPITRAQIIASIFCDIQLNACAIFIIKLSDYRRQDGQSLMFPSLIIELCQLVGVEDDPEDYYWIDSGKPVAPLKKRGEGGAMKIKKRKLGSSSHTDQGSQPSSVEDHLLFFLWECGRFAT